MSAGNFGYLMQNFIEARGALLAPHPQGEREAFRNAYMYCFRGFMNGSEVRVTDDDARDWIGTVKRLTRFEDSNRPEFESIYDSWSVEDRSELSDSVDRLAFYFQCEVFGWT